VEVEPFDLCASLPGDPVDDRPPGILTLAFSPHRQPPPRPRGHAQAYGRLGDRGKVWFVPASRFGVWIHVVEDGLKNTRHYGRHLLIARGGSGMEHELSSTLARIDSVEEHVEVYVQTQRRIEALYDGDRSGLESSCDSWRRALLRSQLEIARTRHPRTRPVSVGSKASLNRNA
jgi:hypothetical protein